MIESLISCNSSRKGHKLAGVMMPAETGEALLYAVMSSEGVVLRTFETVEEARIALYAMSAPVGRHPKLVQRDRSGSEKSWSPVGCAGIRLG
jgi:hypothetical protein